MDTPIPDKTFDSIVGVIAAAVYRILRRRRVETYLLEVSATSAAVLVVRFVLLLPLVEVDFEPVLFRFVLEQPLPVRTLLLFHQCELGTAVADGVL